MKLTVMARRITAASSIFCYMIFIAGCGVSKKEGYGSGSPPAGKQWNLRLPGNAMLDMVWISPGTFIMGSPVSEEGRKADEGPQTKVAITKGYWLGRTEVTIEQWKAVTGEA